VRRLERFTIGSARLDMGYQKPSLYHCHYAAPRPPSIPRLWLRAGRPVEAFDAQIAATALTASAALATRDIRRSQEPRNEQMAVTRLAGR
jgi:hypothetical protein